MYSGWLLSPVSRGQLLSVFPPVYPDVIAHHITLKRGSSVIPPKAHTEVIGIADDGAGVQCLVVAVNGEHAKADGRTYHITWSIDRSRDRKPVHSNDVLANGFERVEPIEIATTPFYSNDGVTYFK